MFGRNFCFMCLFVCLFARSFVCLFVCLFALSLSLALFGLSSAYLKVKGKRLIQFGVAPGSCSLTVCSHLSFFVDTLLFSSLLCFALVCSSL